MKSAVPLIALFLLAFTLRAEDAPQFRGPGGLGVSKETNLPTTWSAKEGAALEGRAAGQGAVKSRHCRRAAST